MNMFAIKTETVHEGNNRLQVEYNMHLPGEVAATGAGCGEPSSTSHRQPPLLHSYCCNVQQKYQDHISLPSRLMSTATENPRRRVELLCSYIRPGIIPPTPCKLLYFKATFDDRRSQTGQCP